MCVDTTSIDPMCIQFPHLSYKWTEVGRNKEEEEEEEEEGKQWRVATRSATITKRWGDGLL